MKNSSFPLAMSMKLYISALVLISWHGCEKSIRESPSSHRLPYATGRHISTREPTSPWIYADICRQDGAICSKNSEIVPYQRRIPRLTVAVPDYGSCSWSSLWPDKKFRTLFTIWPFNQYVPCLRPSLQFKPVVKGILKGICEWFYL